MPSYIMIAKVDQIVTKEIQLTVNAGSEEEAENKAREALQLYPQPIFVEGVKRIITNKSTYWIPKSIEFSRLEEEKIVA